VERNVYAASTCELHHHQHTGNQKYRPQTSALSGS